MSYEIGMHLVFDPVERVLVVSFRNVIKTLGPFADQKSAVQAGERFCRENGWVDEASSEASVAPGHEGGQAD